MLCDGFCWAQPWPAALPLIPGDNVHILVCIFWFACTCGNGQELLKMAIFKSPRQQRFQLHASPIHGNCGSRTQLSMASAWTCVFRFSQEISLWDQTKSSSVWGQKSHPLWPAQQLQCLSVRSEGWQIHGTQDGKTLLQSPVDTHMLGLLLQQSQDHRVI